MFWEDEVRLNVNTLQCALRCREFDVTGAAAQWVAIILGNTETITENEATTSFFFF